MCDYSLHDVATRPAKVGDRLVSTQFANSITRGFAAVGEPNVAVCLLPGTELVFDHDVEYERALGIFPNKKLRENVARFRHQRSPDTASNEDLRLFRLHLAENRVGAPTINSTISALRFFFTVTLDRADAARYLTFVHEPRKLPLVLSPEEVARLLAAAPGVKYKAALSVAYGAGLRVSEVTALKVSDIDSKRMMLRIEQGKGGKDR